MAFVAELPAYALQVPTTEREARVDATSDQCVVDGEHFFVLANLDLAVLGASGPLRWTVWTSLSRANFERASELWHTAGRESEPPYFGWLSNPIPGYPRSVNIKTLVHTQPVGVRPQLEVIDEGHPLFADQRAGISRERCDELVHLAMHSAQ